MKAEHRKELETNALADRMGRVVKGMKSAPQRRTLLYLLLVGAAVVVIWMIIRARDFRQSNQSELWLQFEDGAGPSIATLAKDPKTPQGRAAYLQLAFYEAWNSGMRRLATNPSQALVDLDESERAYKELKTQVREDKVYGPEVLYALAVIEEARIMNKREFWTAARDTYKELADKFGTSAYGKIARQRLEIFENETKRNDVLDLYQDLHVTFVRDEKLPLQAPPKLPLP